MRDRIDRVWLDRTGIRFFPEPDAEALERPAPEMGPMTSIPLFPERVLAPVTPLRDPYAEVIPPDILCQMVDAFLAEWNAIYPAILTCHYPDDQGRTHLWEHDVEGTVPPL